MSRDPDASPTGPSGAARPGSDAVDTVDAVTMYLDARAGLAALEVVVATLRVRGHPVESVYARWCAGRMTVVVRGEGLHGDDPEALALRQLARIPSVVELRIGEPSGVAGQGGRPVDQGASSAGA